VNEETDYVSHFLRVLHQDFPAIFASRLEKKGGFVEVDMIRSANDFASVFIRYSVVIFLNCMNVPNVFPGGFLCLH